MQAVNSSYQSLSLLMQLNWDRVLYIGTICLALLLGAWLGSL